MKRKGILQTAFTLTATLLLAACTQDELADKQGEPLPEGKYPLTFTASIDGAAVAVTPQTRASVDGSFNNVDYIAVGIWDGTMVPFRYMTFKKDGVNAAWEYNRKIEEYAEKPYWQSTTNATQVRAWYFNKNNNGEHYDVKYKTGEYPDSGSFSWEVAGDQSGVSYTNSDFLYAFDSFSFAENPKTLHFFHQTAKVVVHIIAGDQTPADITGDKISMTIGDSGNSIYLQGKWKRPDSHWIDDNSRIFGTWTTSGQDKDIITPKELGPKDITVNSDKKQSLASYEALAIPQKISADNRLFKIEIDGYSPFYYTVPAEGIEWKAGTEHTYYITIEGSKLSVTASSSIGWDSGNVGSGSVTLPIGNKTAEEAEIGDFYMSDGSLVGKGATLIQKAACIGIVFQTDPNRIGKAEKDAGYTHGLVMAMKNAASNVTWGPYDTDTGLKNCESWDDCKNDISGLSNCQTIKALNNWNNYPAFKAADDYNTTCKAPTNTTGWYLPASGQLYDMFVNLGKLSTAQPANDNNVYYWSGQAQTVVNNLNNHMTSVTSKDDFEVSGFWSSSESDSNYAWHWYLFTDDYVTCMRSHKSSNDRVRAVLAF